MSKERRDSIETATKNERERERKKDFTLGKYICKRKEVTKIYREKKLYIRSTNILSPSLIAAYTVSLLLHYYILL